MIADNKIFNLGIENLDTLNSFLEELNGDLDIPGFDEDILKQMVSEAEDVTERISEYGTLDEQVIQSIRESGKRTEQQIQKIENQQETASTEPPLGQGIRAESENAPTEEFILCPKVWGKNMAIKRCLSSINVVEAAKIRIKMYSEMVCQCICLLVVGKTVYVWRSLQ